MRWLLCPPPFPTATAFVSDTAWTLFLTGAEGIVFRKSEFNKFLLVLLLSQPLFTPASQRSKMFSFQPGRSKGILLIPVLCPWGETALKYCLCSCPCTSTFVLFLSGFGVGRMEMVSGGDTWEMTSVFPVGKVTGSG